MVVSQDIVQAFWEQVVFKPGGCWLWRGATTGGSPGDPYGIFIENGVREYAHRFAYKLSCGDLGIERPIVRHTCDTRLCVNPAHLRGSTQQGNIKDAVRKRRSLCGLTPRGTEDNMGQHDWVKSKLGHGEQMCKRCAITNREAVALGMLNQCPESLEEDGDITDSEPGEECGRWQNGSLTKSCSKAGSEECDFECPYRNSLYK